MTDPERIADLRRELAIARAKMERLRQDKQEQFDRADFHAAKIAAKESEDYWRRAVVQADMCLSRTKAETEAKPQPLETTV